MLRSLRQAVYCPETSDISVWDMRPMRISPRPFAVIRIYWCIVPSRLCSKVRNTSHEKWAELGMHCSMTERRADDATRDVEAWLKCFYMRDHLGSIFNGTISGVPVSACLWRWMTSIVEGLVHVSELGTDYFHFDLPSIRCWVSAPESAIVWVTACE